MAPLICSVCMASNSRNGSIVSRNLSASMRDNYEQHGVAEYYKKVGATYRNPHYPGIRLCLFSWFNRWWQIHSPNTAIRLGHIMFFDMACGSGEATLAFVEWCNIGKKLYHESLLVKDPSSATSSVITPRRNLIAPIALGPEFPRAQIIAADPFTAAAYNHRTSYTCAELSFSDIAEGALPKTSVDISTGSVWELEDIEQTEPHDGPHHVIEMVVCSFALHLLEDASSLFSLLWELSSKARWLVVLAPHKKPEIKPGWGWMKWNIDSWQECSMTDSGGEFLYERVHCRIYRSINY